MGNCFSRPVDPETSQRAETQRGAGRPTVNAQHGGVVNTPQLKDVNVPHLLTGQTRRKLLLPKTQQTFKGAEIT
ncbi:hypothetical protein PFLUV_G00001030 [Perca fluviatilis]|uniref:Uncharacterized protein n=1 Tax=Perca fluviatilis TaxID=8168 RepID=A0A6A5FG29_PERFL|nr:hypothetical protein PFLUV_G00001030 [Perca fluviatilis]